MDMRRFEAQHAAIQRGIDDLRTLSKQGVSENAAEIARLVVSISSTIKLHLAGEDRMLYPAALRAGDAALVRLAQRYQEDMGPLAAEFEAFVRRWNTAQPVRQQAENFRREANTVLRLLWERMQREDNEFYPRMKELKVD
jgi:hemerythrin-like domain-containing protein